MQKIINKNVRLVYLRVKIKGTYKKTKNKVNEIEIISKSRLVYFGKRNNIILFINMDQLVVNKETSFTLNIIRFLCLK